MENTVNALIDSPVASSSLFQKTRSAFKLITDGKDQEARNEFPMEYHFIKKYLPASIEELKSLLQNKLQVV